MKSCGFLFIISLFLVSCTIKRPAPPVSLKCEYQAEPLHIDIQNPRFSWIIPDTTRGAAQTAFQVIVADNYEDIFNNTGNVWDSEKISSSRSVWNEYRGKTLEPFKKYYWRVKIWDKDEKESPYSLISSFTTAMLSEKDMKAHWIEAVKDKYELPPRSVMMRKQFAVPRKPGRALAYVSGLGNYRLFLNGKRVGDDLLTPGWTEYREKVQYQVYDVTKMLEEGQNAAGSLLGNLWWSSGLGWNQSATYSDGPLKFFMQLLLEYENGDRQWIVSDSTWKFADSPILYNHIYHGETYDARKEIPGWNTPDFDDAQWKKATQVKLDSIRLVAQQAPAIRVHDTLTAIEITEPKKGVFVFDLGQNMVGFARLNVKGEAGTKIEMRFAELLHDDGTVSQENLRSARAIDVYYFKGDENSEIYEPVFTYHGFRYVQVTGLPEKPDKETLKGLVFYSSAPVTGHFECSENILNEIEENIKWGQKGNFMSVPTDCPQRDERLGWMGDAQIFAPTSSYNMHVAQFFHKWVNDITDSQHPSGYVYDVNPAIVVEGPAKPGWGDAVVVVPWVMNKFYDDERIIENNYDGMVAWVEYMHKNSDNYIYEWGEDEWGGYGDWIAVVKSPSKPIGAAYFFYSAKLLSQMASKLGKGDDATRFQMMADSIAVAYHNKYFIKEENQYLGGTQTAHLLPLAFGITPDSMKNLVVSNIVNDVVQRDTHVTTGFLGTGYILPMLSDYGHHDLAYALAIQTTYPSWGYMVKNGATSIWELWDSNIQPPDKMNSRNHFALGSVGEWFYGYLGGIQPLENGFKRHVIHPRPAGDLQWVNSSLETDYGLLVSNWKKTNDSIDFHIVIPANTVAQVHLPNLSGKDFVVFEGGSQVFNGEKFTGNKYFKLMDVTKDRIVMEVKPGTYDFMLKPSM
ncbi:MAG: family 78 glycoside hydrolase catalytic domain [Bacteroidales bacterium]